MKTRHLMLLLSLAGPLFASGLMSTAADVAVSPYRAVSETHSPAIDAVLTARFGFRMIEAGMRDAALEPGVAPRYVWDGDGRRRPCREVAANDDNACYLRRFRLRTEHGSVFLAVDDQDGDGRPLPAVARDDLQYRVDDGQLRVRFPLAWRATMTESELVERAGRVLEHDLALIRELIATDNANTPKVDTKSIDLAGLVRGT